MPSNDLALYKPPYLKPTIGPNVYTCKKIEAWIQGRRVTVLYNTFMRDLNSSEMVFEEVFDGRLLGRIEIILSEFLNNNKIPIEIKNCIEFWNVKYATWYLCESPMAVAFNKKIEESILRSKELVEQWKNKSKESKERYERYKKEYEESLMGRYCSLIDRNFKIFVLLNILVMSILLNLAILSIKNRNLKLGKI